MEPLEADPSRHAETPQSGAPLPVPAIQTLATRPLVILGGVSFVVHMLVAGNYGYFRDELYYIADGWHLQAGYVDQPLLMGWLAALIRVTVGNSLVAIHIVPALACALIIAITGLIARELGGGRMSQIVAAATSLFAVNFMATGSLFSMDVLDQLWWALGTLILARLLRLRLQIRPGQSGGEEQREEQGLFTGAPGLWLLLGLVFAIGLLTKLTILYFGAALVLALLVTPERRYLRTIWPWLAGGLALVGLLPYLVWNAFNGWPTLEFWRNYGVRSGPLDFFTAQILQMNPIALPLVVAGLVFYFRSAGARYRLLGWIFIFLYLMLTILGTKAYFLAPAYPIVFAAGAVVFERLHPRRWLAWLRPAYVALLALVGVLLAPAIMPILPPADVVSAYGPLTQPLSDRFGWDSLTQTVEQVYEALPPEQRAQACVLASNYGEASALQQLAAPGRLPPVISGHNNYFLWGPGTCTGQVLIGVGYSPADFQSSPAQYAHITLAATERCQYCIDFEDNLPITVATDPAGQNLRRLWPLVKHYQ